MAETDAPLPPPARCSLCGHPWSAHVGGGPHAVWVTCCADPHQAPSCGAADLPAGSGDPDQADADRSNRSQGPRLAQRIVAAGGAGLPTVAGLTGPAPTCYCRRSIEDFRLEARRAARGGATSADEAGPTAGSAEHGAAPALVVVLCVTCGAAPAEDTQCRPCRQARQQAAQARFAARQAQLARDNRRRARGR